MDFFAQQDKTRRKTKLLVFYFIVAVAALIARLPRLADHFFRRASALPSLRRTTAVRALESAAVSRRCRRRAGGHLYRQRYKTMGWRLAAARFRQIDGRAACQLEHERFRTNANCSTSSRKWPSRPACPCRRSMSWMRRRHQRLCRRPQTRGRHHHRHTWLHEIALARRITGRHRPRIQPHSQRRYAAEPPAYGNHLWHSLPRHHRTGSFANGAWRRSRSRTKSFASARFIVARHRLHRCFFRAPHSGRCQPPARISRRCLVRPVHAQSGRHHRRVEKNRRPGRNGFAP